MASPLWTRPPYPGVRSAYDATSTGTVRYGGGIGVGGGLDSDYATRESYAHLSPTTSRRKIVEMERRLAELRQTSDTMRRQLGKAERSLRDLDLNDPVATAASSAGVHRRHRRRHLSTGRRSGEVRFDDDDLDDTSGSWSDDELMTSFPRHYHQHQHRYQSAAAAAGGGLGGGIPGDRESLRQEIARLREDLRILRRQCASYDDVTGLAAGRNTSFRDVDDYSHHHHHNHGHRQQYSRDSELSDWGRRQIRSGSVDDICLARETARPQYYNRDRYDVSATCCGGTGLRSVLYKPIVTQHNKASLLSPTATLTGGAYNRNLYDTFDTSGKSAFKPCRPSDINIGDIVKFRRSGGRIEHGRVKYVGHLPGKSEAYLGVELENATGSHDGLHNGFRYFQCKPNRGLFVAFDHVIMAWANY